MAPRLDLFPTLRIRNAPATSYSFRSFTSTPSLPKTLSSAQRIQLRKRHDPYAVAQAKARTAANRSRQEVLKAERAAANGSPVRGVITPFVLSFDNARPPKNTEESSSRLNYYFTEKELEDSLQHSKLLATPNISTLDRYAPSSDPQAYAERTSTITKGHENAREAIKRITALENSSSKERFRINVQRCIDKFGRHKTDLTLRPKPQSTSPRPKGYISNEKTPRGGPDTGSSEVQVAILTAKIRALANSLDTTGRKDHHNKRNLQLMVHRRAKLLLYLRRKERGGERWQHLTDTLGLTEGTWKGEITL